MFDELVSDYPAMRHHLAADADIVDNKDFDSGIVKIQRGIERTLTTAQKRAVSRFLLDGEVDVEEAEEEKEETYASRIVNRSVRQRLENTTAASRYRSTNHVNISSNMAERLFSYAKINMRDKRKSMSPYHLELLLFLRSNIDMWDASTVQDCIDNPREDEDI